MFCRRSYKGCCRHESWVVPSAFLVGQLVPAIELLCSCRGITGGKKNKEWSGHRQEGKGRSGERFVQHIVLDCDLFALIAMYVALFAIWLLYWRLCSICDCDLLAIVIYWRLLGGWGTALVMWICESQATQASSLPLENTYPIELDMCRHKHVSPLLKDAYAWHERRVRLTRYTTIKI